MVAQYGSIYGYQVIPIKLHIQQTSEGGFHQHIMHHFIVKVYRNVLVCPCLFVGTRFKKCVPSLVSTAIFDGNTIESFEIPKSERAL